MAMVEVTGLEPNLQELVHSSSLKWMFVGGKGGVGKTTTSCCLAVQLAALRRSVLVVSTDPAHNLSDAFGQKFSRVPTLVEGFDNLYCMEIDPTAEVDVSNPDGGGQEMAGLTSFFREFSSSIPGIDEAMSFLELMKHIRSYTYDVTVFDTAPTGHTLRLLAMPATFDKALSKILALRDRFGPLLGSMGAMMGGAAPSEGDLLARLDEIQAALRSVQARLQNPDETTFVCVCIPEFLSLYETERLVQELTKFDIDTRNIVVNQVLFVEDDAPCARCHTRKRMQQKYLTQIRELYGDDFHVVTTPLLNEEVRGVERIRAFGRFLLQPYTLATPLPAVLAGPAAPSSAAAASSK